MPEIRSRRRESEKDQPESRFHFWFNLLSLTHSLSHTRSPDPFSLSRFATAAAVVAVTEAGNRAGTAADDHQKKGRSRKSGACVALDRRDLRDSLSRLQVKEGARQLIGKGNEGES